ncbi:hypothetical protein RQM59_05005 [Flavobacteriaceae bacterium S356]|uniref:Lipid/polyisoprenoid-binding YceI-like domain-containing protein n=1 Tax=Asprobacillus argus TaxID=3076534 RepID=A0ABU3LDD7_9FLAO|nr:hypothetical protein [Flavobacteriaceae bacterium S356]
MKGINNQAILDIKTFNINENYMEFSDEKGYAIDGGIEFHFVEKVITIGWNFEKESYEYAEMPYTASFDYYELNLEKLNEFIGKRIISLELIETEFEVIVDYTMKTEKTKVISGVQIDFDNDLVLRVTTSFFEIDIENKLPVNISPDIQGNLLIDIGNSFKYNT